MAELPPIYHRLVKNRLIPQEELKSALMEFLEKERTKTNKELRDIHHPGEVHQSSNDAQLPTESHSQGNDENGHSASAPDFILADSAEQAADGENYSPLEKQASENTPSSKENISPKGLDNEKTSHSSSASDSSSPSERETLRKLNKEFLAFLESRQLLNSWQASQLLAGQTRFNLGRYRMITPLGAGGYGQVFLARPENDPSNIGVEDLATSRPYDVAVKVLTNAEENPRRVKRFLREIEINKFLNHPNIVHFIESGESGKVHYAVYEYLDGKTAYQINHQETPISGSLAGYIIYQIACALVYLHERGFVHRDIKPGNILFTQDGNVKLADMGLTTPMVSPQAFAHSSSIPFLLTQDPDAHRHQVAGTSDYLSPDQIRHPDQPNVLWDIYSLGCTFYYLVTGIVPFPSGNSVEKLSAHLRSEAPDPKMFNPGLSWELTHLILDMMNKDPKKRPQTAEIVCQRLRPWAGNKADLSAFLHFQTGEVKKGKKRHPSSKDFNWDKFLEDDIVFNGHEISLKNPQPENTDAEKKESQKSGLETSAADKITSEKSQAEIKAAISENRSAEESSKNEKNEFSRESISLSGESLSIVHDTLPTLKPGEGDTFLTSPSDSSELNKENESLADSSSNKEALEDEETLLRKEIHRYEKMTNIFSIILGGLIIVFLILFISLFF